MKSNNSFPAGLLEKYHDQQGDFSIKETQIFDGFKLGGWVLSQRSTRQKGKLSSDRIERLNAHGFVWEFQSQHDKEWEFGFKILKEERRRRGNFFIESNYIVDGFKLGQWVNVQCTNKEKLLPDRRHRFDDIGFVWNAVEAAWERGFDFLKLYKKHNGYCLVPLSCVVDNFKLGTWASRTPYLSVVRRSACPEIRCTLHMLGPGRAPRTSTIFSAALVGSEILIRWAGQVRVGGITAFGPAPGCSTEARFVRFGRKAAISAWSLIRRIHAEN